MMRTVLKIQVLGVLLASTSVVASTQNSCDNLIGCKKKICHIEQDIVVAKKMENKDRVKGLQISLDKVTKYCTNDKLIKDLEDKIEDTKKDLQEDKADYEEALKDNKSDKVEKYKNKMAEENSKIEILESELKELR